MIRFLIGCLLAIAVLWAALFTIGFTALVVTGHQHKTVHRQAP
jgi:hypothetical protein